MNSKTKVGKQVILVFSVYQHYINVGLLQLILEFLDCGKTILVLPETKVIIQLPSFMI